VIYVKNWILIAVLRNWEQIHICSVFLYTLYNSSILWTVQYIDVHLLISSTAWCTEFNCNLSRRRTRVIWIYAEEIGWDMEISNIIYLHLLCIYKVSQKNVPCHIWWYYFAIFNQRFNFFAVGWKTIIILIVVFISPKYLTVRLLEILKVATSILQPVHITEIRLKIMQTL
jgi:hypothetical protein